MLVFKDSYLKIVPNSQMKKLAEISNKILNNAQEAQVYSKKIAYAELFVPPSSERKQGERDSDGDGTDEDEMEDEDDMEDDDSRVDGTDDDGNESSGSERQLRRSSAPSTMTNEHKDEAGTQEITDPLFSRCVSTYVPKFQATIDVASTQASELPLGAQSPVTKSTNAEEAVDGLGKETGALGSSFPNTPAPPLAPPSIALQTL